MSIQAGKERLYLHAPNANIVMCFMVEGAPEEGRFREALEAAAARHGVFATRAVQGEDGAASYEPSPIRPQQVDCRPWQVGASAEEEVAALMKASFDIRQGEWVRHILLQNTHRWLWVMGMHHMAGDGLSMLCFAQDVLRAMAGQALGAFLPLEPFDGSEIPGSARMNPVFRLMARSVARSWQKRERRFTQEDFERMRAKYWQGRMQKALLAEISGEELTALRTACHAHNATLTAALTAAFAQASGESEVGYAASLRKKGCESMANLATGVSIRKAYDPDKPFWDNAQAMGAALREKLEDDGKKFLFFNFMGSIPGTLIDGAYYSAFDGFSSPVAERAAGMLGFSGKPKGLSLTNLGDVPMETAYGPYLLTGVDFYPPMIPGTRRLLGVATVHGRMAVTMQFADEYQQNAAVFEKALRTLRELAVITE